MFSQDVVPDVADLGGDVDVSHMDLQVRQMSWYTKFLVLQDPSFPPCGAQVVHFGRPQWTFSHGSPLHRVSISFVPTSSTSLMVFLVTSTILVSISLSWVSSLPSGVLGMTITAEGVTPGCVTGAYFR